MKPVKKRAFCQWVKHSMVFLLASLSFLFICLYFLYPGEAALLSLIPDFNWPLARKLAMGLMIFSFCYLVVLSRKLSQALRQAEELSLENSRMVKVIRELRHNLEELRFYAETDTMTGTANRVTGFNILNSQLDLAKKNNWPLTLCFVDVDNLKQANDVHGHFVGDELLINISNILRNSVRKSDTISRIGGDEFLVIFPKCALTEAKEVWQRVEENIACFNKSENRPYRISLSFGFAQYIPGQEISAQMLIRQADYQMYRLKRPTGTD